MPILSKPPGVIWWTATGCAVSSLVVIAALTLPIQLSLALLLGALATGGLLLLLALPVHVLPALALVAAVAISDRLADYDTAPLLNPAGAVMLVWLFRRIWSTRDAGNVPAQIPGRQHGALLGITMLLVVWTLPLILRSTSPRLGLAWVVTILLCVAGPLLVRDTERELTALTRALPWVGAVAAGYAVLEALLGYNPLFDPLLRAVGSGSGQHWAVYRSESSFGHPLVAGLAFAVVLVFCSGRWLETRSGLFALLAAVNGAGLVSTVSRGSYAAAGLGVAALVGCAMLVKGRVSRTRMTAVVLGFGLMVTVAVNMAVFAERTRSAEASASIAARSNTEFIALTTARAYNWLGAGPANSLAAAAPYNFQRLPIENSYYQLLISVGVPGLLLFCLLILLSVLSAIRHRNLAVAAALVTFAVAISGFAAMDTRRDLIVLFGLLMMLSTRESQAGTDAGHRVAAEQPLRTPATPVTAR